MSVESDGAVKPKRSIFKFTSLSKRMNKSARNLLDLDSEPQEPQEDEGISPPWNFQVCPSASHLLMHAHEHSA
jgi:hypothetical protein